MATPNQDGAAMLALMKDMMVQMKTQQGVILKSYPYWIRLRQDQASTTRCLPWWTIPMQSRSMTISSRKVWWIPGHARQQPGDLR